MIGAAAFALLLAIILAGTVVGSVTGLLPGLHVNTLAPILLALGASLDPLSGALFILVIATAHTIVNVVPTLAAPLPEEDTGLVLLPIQRMAAEGRAHEALTVSVRASWAAGCASAVLALVLLLVVPAFGGIPSTLTRTAVIGILLLLVMRTSRPGRALITFLLAGVAGLLLLDRSIPGPLGGDGTVLLPVFAAFFGLPLMLVALFDDAPPGKTAAPNTHGTPVRSHALPTLVGTFCGLLVSLFPGLTSATAGAFGRALRAPEEDVEDVAMLSAVNTANALGNTAMMVAIGATRSGANAAALRIAPDLGERGASMEAAVLLGGLVLAVALASLLTLRYGPRLVTCLRRLPARPVAAGALVLVSLIILIANGPMGLVVTLLLLPLGFLPHRWGVPRALLMGFLLVPYLVASA